MKGWTEIKYGNGSTGYYRAIMPAAYSLRDTLAELPPSTALEVSSLYGEPDSPTGVWYYPDEKKANIQ